MPSNLVVGARYEETDVTSINLQLVPTALLWQDDNDFQVVRPHRADAGRRQWRATTTCCRTSTSTSACTDSLKARFSYSKTIARAGYGTLAAGQNAGRAGRFDASTASRRRGNQNNPGILPLESDNFDLSLEYYFSDTGYVSVGAFQKNVDNFIGNSVEQINLFGIRNQTGGPRAQAAAACVPQCTAERLLRRTTPRCSRRRRC